MFDVARRIFDLLSRGSLPEGEADRLLGAVRHATAAPDPQPGGAVHAVRVEVLKRGMTDPGELESTMRVPLAVVHAGLKFASMVHGSATEMITTWLHEHGVTIELSHLTRAQLEALLGAMRQLTVNVVADDRQVRITAE